MGTSSSSKGRNSRSPLVPAHADSDPDQPLPPPEGQRFRGFRTEFGRAVSGTGEGSFASALSKYARDATGGSAVGPRRFGPAYSAGGSLFDLLSELQSGGTGEQSAGVDLSALAGRPLAEAIETIAQALAPENADSDLIRTAVQEALAEALPEMASFEPASLEPDGLIAVLIEFFAQVLFLDIVSDAGEAWDKASGGERTIEAEGELFDIIHTAVDKHLGPALAEGIQDVSRARIEAIERQAIRDIWAEWEGNA